MTKYYYESMRGAGSVKASNDDEALEMLRLKFGEHLVSIMTVYVEESKDKFRTIWVE